MYHVPGVGYYFGNVSTGSLERAPQLYLEMGKFAGNAPDKWISDKLERVLNNLQNAYNKIAGDPTLSSSKLQAVTTKKAELTKWLMDLRETIVNPTNVNWQSAKYTGDKAKAKKAAEENDVALPYGAPAELYRAAGLPVPGEKAKEKAKAKEPPRKPTLTEKLVFEELLGTKLTGNETVDELYAALAAKGLIKGGEALVDAYTSKTGKAPPPGLPTDTPRYEPEESFLKKIPLWVWPVGIGSIGLLAAFVMMGMRKSPAPVTANPYWRRRR